MVTICLIVFVITVVATLAYIVYKIVKGIVYLIKKIYSGLLSSNELPKLIKKDLYHLFTL